MLHVKTPEEVLALIEREFTETAETEAVTLSAAMGRVLAQDIAASEYVPGFDRTTVDGYAVRAQDTFGCTDAIPAILRKKGEVLMGEGAACRIGEGECAAVPTGGELPEGSDCAVMIEYTEDYGDGTIGILKPAAPGQNVIFRGDDVFPGKVILEKGRVLSSSDIGALAAVGCVSVPVVRRPRIGVLSTGDELVEPGTVPGPGQVRDVNSPMLEALLTAFGAEVIHYGIVKDDEALLSKQTALALSRCDAVLLSGGSSVGVRDAACRIIDSLGTILLHGIAIKPGKPTILGKCGSKPLIGLPGHPVAAYFITKLFVLPLLSVMTGRRRELYTVTAKLAESISANHGRAQYQCCRLVRRDGELYAYPVRAKSGLITSLAGTDGYFGIGRDCEGLPRLAEVQVTISQGE